MPVRGYVDGVAGGAVVGWVRDDADPDGAVLVTGELDGVSLPTVIADERREDLRDGGGRGFRVPIPDDFVLTPGPHVVAVWPAGAEVTLPLADDWVALGRDEQALDGVDLQAPRGGPAVLIGESGWRFGWDTGPTPRGHAGLDADVDALIRFRAAAAKVRASACCAVVPDKRDVYADRLPPALRAPDAERWTRRLEARLRDDDHVAILDLHAPLMDARYYGRVFTRTGPHVSWIGAFHAYRAVAKVFAASLPGMLPRSAAEADSGAVAPVADELAGLPVVAWRDDRLVPVDPPAGPDDYEPTLRLAPPPARHRGTGLIVHEPGGVRIAGLLAEHFVKPVVEMADSVSPELLRRHKPDAVIWLKRGA